MKILREGIKFTSKIKYVNIKIDEKKIMYSTNGDMIYKLQLPIKEMKDFKVNKLVKQIPQHNYPLL